MVTTETMNTLKVLPNHAAHRWHRPPIPWPSARHQPKLQDHGQWGQCVICCVCSPSSLHWYQFILNDMPRLTTNVMHRNQTHDLY